MYFLKIQVPSKLQKVT